MALRHPCRPDYYNLYSAWGRCGILADLITIAHYGAVVVHPSIMVLLFDVPHLRGLLLITPGILTTYVIELFISFCWPLCLRAHCRWFPYQSVLLPMVSLPIVLTSHHSADGYYHDHLWSLIALADVIIRLASCETCCMWFTIFLPTWHVCFPCCRDHIVSILWGHSYPSTPGSSTYMLSLVSQVSNFYSALRRCGIIAVFGISIARYGAAASLPSSNFYSALRRFHLRHSYVSVFGL